MAEKLEMMSEDIIQDNIEYIANKFPNALKETKDENGKLVKRIDFDVLKQELSNVVIDDKKERYQMTWPDKKKSILLANSRINGTLRPVKEKSVDFDNTQNLYIEGDNLDVLKLLRETYLGKVKMIYIDPPYNTGNDFVYNDDFAQSSDEYLNNSGQFDDQGNRMVTNSESNGRFHTDWLNMMYPRLKVARDLLTDDGVIFISIDDNEYENLKRLCDEVFGAHNFVTNLIWQSTGGSNTGSSIVTVTEYILLYVKSKSDLKIRLLEKNKDNYNEKDEFFNERGAFYYQKLDGKFTPSHYSESLTYPLNINGIEIWPGGQSIKSNELWNWRWSKTKVEWGIKNGFIEYIDNGSKKGVYFKNYELVDNEGKPRKPSVPPKNVIGTNIATTASGTSELYALFGNDYFPFPKSSKLIQYLMNLIDFKSGIVMDFFSGSATTADAVFQQNANINGKLQFILVQLPELTNNADFPTICDIGEERIRRAGKKIKEENPMFAGDLDTGFRVLKLDSSNMNDVYYNPNAMTQSLLDETVDNIKPDRTPLDLLFQVMLELGIELSAKITEKEINGKKYYQVNENDIVACFDDNLDNDLLIEIAKLQPLYAVFKDSSFATDSVGINNEQIFKTYSPGTKIKVL